MCPELDFVASLKLFNNQLNEAMSWFTYCSNLHWNVPKMEMVSLFYLNNHQIQIEFTFSMKIYDLCDPHWCQLIEITKPYFKFIRWKWFEMVRNGWDLILVNKFWTIDSFSFSFFSFLQIYIFTLSKKKTFYTFLSSSFFE